MKYIIDVPDEHTDIKIFYTDADMKIIQSMRCEPYTEPDRKGIEDEVWDFVRRIICPSDCCEDSISKYTKEFLGIPAYKTRAIFKDLSYQEVKTKYEAWKNEIRVGDEVLDHLGKPYIIYKISDVTAYGVGFDECSLNHNCFPVCYNKKTGRHFDEIEELLKKIKEG